MISSVSIEINYTIKLVSGLGVVHHLLLDDDVLREVLSRSEWLCRSLEESRTHVLADVFRLTTGTTSGSAF